MSGPVKLAVGDRIECVVGTRTQGPVRIRGVVLRFATKDRVLVELDNGDSYETDAMHASQKSSDIDENYGTWEWAGITAMMCYRNMVEKVIGRAVVIAADDTTEAGVRDAIRDAIGSWALS